MKKLLIVLLLTGCTIEGGDVVEEDLNKLITCTDTRDGEVFTFNTNSVHNVRQGIGAPTTADIITLKGKKMTIGDNMAVWLKCADPVPAK